MYLPLFIFLISIGSLVLLFFRKFKTLGPDLMTRRIDHTRFLFDVPELEDISVIVVRQMKRYGYLTLVTTLRIYVRGGKVAHTLAKTIASRATTLKYKYLSKKKQPGMAQTSKFLKTVGEYKRKIKSLKDRIKQEEGIE